MASSKKPKPKPKPKPTTKKAVKERKRTTVAAGILAAKPAKVIAQDLGCSSRQVERIAAEPETQFLVTEALRPHRDKLTQLAAVALNAVELAMQAEKGDQEDHKNRMAAVQRYGDLLGLAQGQLAKQEEKHDDGVLMTWEELCLVYRRRSNVQSNQPQPPTVDATRA